MRKLIFTFFLCLLAAVQSAWGYDFSYTYEGDTLYYNVIDSASKTVEVTYKSRVLFSSSYSPYVRGTIQIPATVTNGGVPYAVTSIGKYAFRDCNDLTSVTIPNSVTYIGESTFYNCSGLTSVTIPNSVTYIGGSTFYNCSGLTSVTIPNSVTYIGEGTFYNCSGLTSVTIGNSVTSIGDGAFLNCSGLTSVTIGNSVTSIGNQAFYHCSGLTSITIPNSVTSIGNQAFYACSGLTSVTIPNSVTSIGKEAFSYCDGLTSVTIPNSVTSIGNQAFCACSGLTSVTIQNSVTSIGDGAFSGCSKLPSFTATCSSGQTLKYQVLDTNSQIVYVEANSTSISGDLIIPSTVTYQDITYTVKYILGTNSFKYCDLSNVTIPNSVISIGNEAFENCSLTNVTIPASVTNIGAHAFQNCINLTSVILPPSVSSIKEWTFYNCTGLINVTIPNSIVSIGTLAFFGCSDLMNVTIPSSVSNISYFAFKYCNSLTSVNIQNGVKSIYAYAFCNCSSLTSVNLPNSLKSIGRGAFLACRKMKEATIGDSLISIPDSSFMGCSSLKKVILGKSVSSLAKTSFSGDTAVAVIVSKNAVPPTGAATVWASANKSIPIYVPCSSIDAYKSSACWSAFTNFKPLYNLKLANGSAVDSVEVMYGDTLPEPVKEGFLFDGWYTADSTNFTTTSGICADTLYAHWQKIYTVVLIDGANVQNLESYSREHLLPTPTKDDYTFKGWYNADGKLFTAPIFTQDTVLYAQWQQNTHTLTLIDGDSVAHLTASNGHVTLPTPAKSYYSFVGWFTADSVQFTANSALTTDTTLYAHWQKHAYVIALVDGSSVSSIEVNDGKISLPAPTKSDYSFDGWYNADSVAFTNNSKLYSDTIIYAHWTQNVYSIIYFDGAKATTKKVSNGHYTLLTPTKAGYTFQGWYTADSVQFTTDSLLSANIILYAHWTIANSVAKVTSEQMVVYAADGAIHIGGTAAAATIYGIGGKLIYSGKAREVAVPFGVYVVKVEKSSRAV